jgi:hypothetical protein
MLFKDKIGPIVGVSIDWFNTGSVNLLGAFGAPRFPGEAGRPLRQRAWWRRHSDKGDESLEQVIKRPRMPWAE